MTTSSSGVTVFPSAGSHSGKRGPAAGSGAAVPASSVAVGAGVVGSALPSTAGAVPSGTGSEFAHAVTVMTTPTMKAAPSCRTRTRPPGPDERTAGTRAYRPMTPERIPSAGRPASHERADGTAGLLGLGDVPPRGDQSDGGSDGEQSSDRDVPR